MHPLLPPPLAPRGRSFVVAHTPVTNVLSHDAFVLSLPCSDQLQVPARMRLPAAGRGGSNSITLLVRSIPCRAGCGVCLRNGRGVSAAVEAGLASTQAPLASLAELRRAHSSEAGAPPEHRTHTPATRRTTSSHTTQTWLTIGVRPTRDTTTRTDAARCLVASACWFAAQSAGPSAASSVSSPGCCC